MIFAWSRDSDRAHKIQDGVRSIVTESEVVVYFEDFALRLLRFDKCLRKSVY